jgi:hypothetical protein
MEMVKTHLFNMAKQAKELHGMLGDQDQVPEWVQEKLAVSCNMLDSVYDYLTPKMAKSAGYTTHLPAIAGTVAGGAAVAHRYVDAKPREGGLSRLQISARADAERRRAQNVNEGADPDSGVMAKYDRFRNAVADDAAKQTLLHAVAFGVPVAAGAALGTRAAMKELQIYRKAGPELLEGTKLEKGLRHVGIKLRKS